MIPINIRPASSAVASMLAVLLFAGLRGGGSCEAQIVPDGKFGSSTPVAGPNFEIPASLGATRGNNLFHSFTQFDLKAGDVADFTGPAEIQNIITRVTGGTASSIDGRIRSSIAGAGFYLINPAGIVFGPNATLDVSGSFAASSADYLKLADGARFVASIDADDSRLSTAPVSAFGFLGGSAAPVSVDGSRLRVRDGGGLSFLGGDVTVNGGRLTAPGGDLQVTSVRAVGEVPVDAGSMGADTFRASFPEAGAIQVQAKAVLEVSGRGGGRIVIRGGSLRVEDARLDANTTGTISGRGIDVAVNGNLDLVSGGQLNSLSPSGQGGGGSIRVSAESVRLDGAGKFDQFFNPRTQISTATGAQALGGGRAPGGDITIRAGRLELFNSAQISSTTFGAGDAGRIDIEARSVTLDALLVTPTQIVANTQQNQGGGKAGDISVRTDTLELRNGATILATTFGSGRAGRVDLEARSINVFSGSIITAGTFGAGPGGNVEVRADSLRIDGTDRLGGGPSLLTGIQAVTTSPDAPAPGGNIRIRAGTVEMTRSASVFTTSFGRGAGGGIEVSAGTVQLANESSLRASGEASGPAGNLAVHADASLRLADGSAIRTSAPGSSGGDIRVSAGTEIRLTGSEINARAGKDGGNISVAAPELVYLRLSTLTGQADTTGTGFGNGGNLTIEPPRFFIVNDGALVSKSSFGNGGNITILSDFFFNSTGIIDASAPFGLPGTVSVSAPDVDLSGSLVGLPANLIDASAQLRPDCGVRLAGNVSSFIVLGRGGLPLQPGGFLPSSLFMTLDEIK